MLFLPKKNHHIHGRYDIQSHDPHRQTMNPLHSHVPLVTGDPPAPALVAGGQGQHRVARAPHVADRGHAGGSHDIRTTRMAAWAELQHLQLPPAWLASVPTDAAHPVAETSAASFGSTAAGLTDTGAASSFGFPARSHTPTPRCWSDMVSPCLCTAKRWPAMATDTLARETI